MGLSDRISNAAEDAKGKAKEHFGKAVGDDQTAAEGKMDQLKAGLKDKVEDVKDAAARQFNKHAD